MRHEGMFFHYESCPWAAWDNIMNRARLVANYQRLMKSELDCDEGIVQVALIEADHLVCYLKKKFLPRYFLGEHSVFGS